MAPGAPAANERQTTSSVCCLNKVTERYVWPDEALRDGPATTAKERLSKLKNDPGTNSERLPGGVPILDLSPLSRADHAERKKLAKEMGRAAEQWGFFQVINHGVPEAVVGAMEAHGRDFFDGLSVEAKERGVETDSAKHTYYHGYGGRFQHLNARVPWLEYLGESYSPVNGAPALLEKIWPGVGNPSFRHASEDYSRALVKLGRQILELLAESLDLSPDVFSQHFSDSTKYQAHWRFNHYPACPEPSKTLGLGPHTDPCGITIVRQDDVGGFQLMNRGRWLDVGPLEGSFLVNIGDCLQAWTNGRFSSVLHRAVVNEKSERLSIVFPFSPPSDYKISIPPSLIDKSHPLKYLAPIEWHHLAVIKGNHVAREALSSTFGLKVV